VASVCWERNALGYVLDLNESARRRVIEQVGHLRRFPLLGAPAGGTYEGKRRLIVGPYSVVYEYDADTEVVNVVAVAFGGSRFR
jgi:mRNA-degrading endonuclease RelE of RelBE toxin-antitoxin system